MLDRISGGTGVSQSGKETTTVMKTPPGRSRDISASEGEMILWGKISPRRISVLSRGLLRRRLGARIDMLDALALPERPVIGLLVVKQAPIILYFYSNFDDLGPAEATSDIKACFNDTITWNAELLAGRQPQLGREREKVVL
ncbi:hypothetical protein TWF679_009289 [Orbilia oligospora]|nr:hypothetical protein TWF679_009289 [Orbilia oligospora]